VKGLPYRVKILCPETELCLEHGTDLATLSANLPPNVDIEHDDGSYESWLSAMACSRMVVLPITQASMYAHGAGTYLVAMALKKCVIVSENEGSHGILDGGQAILVPVGDPDALRRAIVRAWEDDSYRDKIAEAGYKYAVSMGDEESMQRRILEASRQFLVGFTPA
jgi:glycosyltransferase involved in cell wall biosynthesis